MAQAGRVVAGMMVEKPVELRDKVPDRASVAARVLGGVEQDETVMGVTALIETIREGAEVANVLTDYGTTFVMCCREDVRVWERA